MITYHLERNSFQVLQYKIMRANFTGTFRYSAIGYPAIYKKLLSVTPLRQTIHVASCPQTFANQTDMNWSAVVSNADFLFNDVQNESFAEQLRERVRFFNDRGWTRDFWIVPDPVWLDEKFPGEAKRVRRPCVALVSTNSSWITFMKLRLDRVLQLHLGNMSKEDALKSKGQIPEFRPPTSGYAPYNRYSNGWWEPFLP
jgi:hypothetical protein